MIRGTASSALLLLGTLLLAGALGIAGRTYLGQWLHDAGKPAAALELVPARLEPDHDPPVSTQSPGGSDPGASAAPSPEAPAATVSSAAPIAIDDPDTPSAAPTPVPDFGPPVRMLIPSIDLDASVTEVGISDGTYEVPGWDVGWHEDSAQLGAPGNSVFNGHLQTIDAGKVFARLHELRPGDLIYLYTPGYRTSWVVESSERTPNSIHEFVAPTRDVRATLYTCEGRFDWSTRRYSHYRVVVARFVEATKR
ncbi:MAG: class F sortase [Sphingomonadaceae bacterium]